MTIKEIIKISATYLGMEDVIKYLLELEEGEYTLTEIDTLTRLANMVINELACSYVPLTVREQLITERRMINFSDLSECALEIICAYDTDKEPVEYEQFPEYIISPSMIASVEYRYLPSNYGLTDKVGYNENQVPARVIAYGVVSEYCLTERRFDESVMWHQKYLDAISDICTPKNSKIKQRRWA